MPAGKKKVQQTVKRKTKKVEKAAPATVQLSPHALSDTEKKVGQLIVNGLSNVQISKVLKIEKKTIDAHRSSMYRKLRVRNIGQLIGVLLVTGEANLDAYKAYKAA